MELAVLGIVPKGAVSEAEATATAASAAVVAAAWSPAAMESSKIWSQPQIS